MTYFRGWVMACAKNIYNVKLIYLTFILKLWSSWSTPFAYHQINLIWVPLLWKYPSKAVLCHIICNFWPTSSTCDFHCTSFVHLCVYSLGCMRFSMLLVLVRFLLLRNIKSPFHLQPKPLFILDYLIHEKLD